MKCIRENTTCDATVVIRRDADSGLSAMGSRLPELFYRHTVVVDDANLGSLAGVPAKRVFLTVFQPFENLVAQTSGVPSISPLLGSLINCYSLHIAKRRAGDKLEICEKNFRCHILSPLSAWSTDPSILPSGTPGSSFAGFWPRPPANTNN